MGPDACISDVFANKCARCDQHDDVLWGQRCSSRCMSSASSSGGVAVMATSVARGWTISHAIARRVNDGEGVHECRPEQSNQSIKHWSKDGKELR